MEHLTGEPGERPIPESDTTDRLPVLAEGATDSAVSLPRNARQIRDPLAPEVGSGSSGGNARVLRVVTADYLLTVNPVDGTEVTGCPPAERPVPQRRTREERVAHLATRRPSPPPGPPAPELPLLERDDERERLIRLLARGRSIRVTGPSGAGRTALLESVANACADLAPDGVLWLSGYRRTAADLLQDLFTTVYAADGYRPGRDELPGLLHETGAVVVIDDLEIGGAALEELLAAAPECAFLMSSTPDVTAPAADSMVEEVFLSGLTRVACIDLLQLVTSRPLAEDETAWAADLWFESEGLPLRFVQAGALLRQRDALRQPPEPDWDDSVWENGTPTTAPADEIPLPDLSAFESPATLDLPAARDGREALDGALGEEPVDFVPLEIPASTPAILRGGPPADVPLPSLAESAAPAHLLASRLSEAAREALAFAVALDGECPHPSHLPALVGDTHGDAALGELTSVGLAVPVSAHYRLAAGVVQQLAPDLASDGELSDIQAHTAALHYAWWTGHPSVTPERAATESEAILAAMTACRDGGHPSAAVLLARTVAPAFAAALYWGAWERALRIGQEAARLSGEVAEEAYFHHELGVLALSNGNTDRARAELEASIALRGALADRQGTLVGRRTLALVNDRDGTGAAAALMPTGLELTAATTPLAALPPGEQPPVTVISKRLAATPPPHHHGARRLAIVGTRRNLVAVATGVVLAAVLGTIVTLGATSGSSDDSSVPNQVKPIESAQQDDPTTDAPADAASTNPTTGATTPSASGTTSPSAGSPTSTVPGGGVTTAPGGGATSAPVDTTTSGGGAGGGTGGGNTHTPTHTPPSHSTSPSTSASSSPSTSPSTTPSTTPTTETPPPNPTSAQATLPGGGDTSPTSTGATSTDATTPDGASTTPDGATTTP